MHFEYMQTLNGSEVIVARGRQTTASMSRGPSGLRRRSPSGPPPSETG